MKTRKERAAERQERCVEYLRRAGSVERAIDLAKRDGISPPNLNTWLSAWGKLEQRKQGL